MGRQGEKERGSRKGGGKKMITINHRKEDSTANHQYNAFSSVPAKDKLTWNTGFYIQEGVQHPPKDQMDLANFVYKLPGKEVGQPKTGQIVTDSGLQS